MAIDWSGLPDKVMPPGPTPSVRGAIDWSGLPDKVIPHTDTPLDDRSWLGKAADLVVPTGLRLGGAVVGGVLGSAGGPIGTAAGGAAGSGLGETLAEAYEENRGLREKLNPTQIAVQSALGAIPLFGKATTVLGTAAKRAAGGALLGGAGAIATPWAEGETPTARGVATGAGIGAILGGGLGAAEGSAAERAAAKLAAQEAAKKAVEEATQGGTAASRLTALRLGQEHRPDLDASVIGLRERGIDERAPLRAFLAKGGITDATDAAQNPAKLIDIAIGGSTGKIQEGLKAYKEILEQAQKANLPNDVTDLLNLNTMEAAAVGLSRKASREGLDQALADAVRTVGREPRQSALFEDLEADQPPSSGLFTDEEPPTPNTATASRRTVDPLRASATVTAGQQSSMRISPETPRIDRFRMVPGDAEIAAAKAARDAAKAAKTDLVYHGTPSRATTFVDEEGNLILRSNPSAVEPGQRGVFFSPEEKLARGYADMDEAEGRVFALNREALPEIRQAQGAGATKIDNPESYLFAPSGQDLIIPAGMWHEAAPSITQPHQLNLEGLATPSEFEAVNNQIERGTLGTVSSRTVPEGTGGRLSPDALSRIAEATGLSEDEIRPIASAAFERLDKAPEWLVQRSVEDAQRQATRALGESTLDTGKALPVGFTPKLLDEARKEFEARTDLTAEQKAQATKIAAGLFEANVQKSLHEAIDSGIMTPDTATDLLGRAAQAAQTGRAGYAPISRIPDDVLSHIEQAYTKAGVATPTQHFLYRINGSTKLSENPIQASAERFAIIQNEGARNRAMQALVNLRHTNDYFADAIRPLAEGEAPRTGEGVTLVWEAGKPTRYALPEAVARSVNASDPQATNLVTNVLRSFGGVFRAGTTMLNTAFAVPNVVKDVAGYAALSGRSRVAGALDPRVWADWAKGLKSYLSHDEWAQRYFNSGAAFSTFQANATGINRALTEGLGKGDDSALKWLAGKAFESTVGLAEKMNNALENATKIGAFRQMSEAVARGENTFSPEEIAWRTRNFGGSPDFARHGRNGHELNTIIPFLNANIQGLDRLAKFVKHNPKSAAIVAASATAQLLGLQAWNTSFTDPDGTRSWDRIPDREKQQNWVIMLPGYFTDRDTGQLRHNYAKIPAAHETNVIRMPIQAALDESTRNVTGIGNALLSTLPTSPNVDPAHPLRSAGESALSSLNPAIREPAEQLWNRDSYTDMPIVSQRLQNVRPEMQYSDSTSPTARGVGQATALSPARIEHAVQGFTGGVGAQTLSILDSLSGQAGQRAPVTELPGLSAVTAAPVVGGVARPIVRRFVGGPASMNQQAKTIRDQFYDALGDAKELQASVRMKMQAGDLAGAKKLIATPRAKRLYAAANALTQVSTAAGAVHRAGKNEQGILSAMSRLVAVVNGPEAP